MQKCRRMGDSHASRQAGLDMARKKNEVTPLHNPKAECEREPKDFLGIPVTIIHFCRRVEIQKCRRMGDSPACQHCLQAGRKAGLDMRQKRNGGSCRYMTSTRGKLELQLFLTVQYTTTRREHRCKEKRIQNARMKRSRGKWQT
eukprot:scaffold21_cov107-Cylindrotheca_fusiformis.AAC.8